MLSYFCESMISYLADQSLKRGTRDRSFVVRFRSGINNKSYQLELYRPMNYTAILLSPIEINNRAIEARYSIEQTFMCYYHSSCWPEGIRNILTHMDPIYVDSFLSSKAIEVIDLTPERLKQINQAMDVKSPFFQVKEEESND